MALASSVDGQRLARRLSARPAAPFGESFDLCRLRPNDSPPVVLRPGLCRLALFRSARRAPVICSPVLLRRPGEQVTEARLSLRSNPFGGFLFSGRFAPSSRRVATFRPPLRLNLICPPQAPAKSDSASASDFSFSL